MLILEISTIDADAHLSALVVFFRDVLRVMLFYHQIKV